MGFCDENPDNEFCRSANLSKYTDDLQNVVVVPTTISPPTISPTPYKPSKILNLASINDPNTHINIFGADITINGWIVLVGCLSISFFIVFIAYRITKKWCDICETRALRPPPTVARIINLTTEDEQRARRQRKNARSRGRSNQNAENDAIVFNVPIESLNKMMRMQQQQLPGIETNRQMPQLCELRLYNNVESNNRNLPVIQESQPRERRGHDHIELQTIVTPPEAIRERENSASAPRLSEDHQPAHNNRAYRHASDNDNMSEDLPEYTHCSDTETPYQRRESLEM